MKKLSKKKSVKKVGFFSRIVRNQGFLLAIFAILVCLLSVYSFYQVLDFGFWRDDWIFLWTIEQKANLELAWILHPATIYEDWFFFKFFGWNTYLWQGLGIVLRIIASLSIALMMWGFSGSKKIAFVSGLLFAVTFVALETVSWRSVHVVTVVIALLTIGFYFLTQSTGGSKKNYILSIVFFTLSIFADPARSFPIIIPILVFLLGEFWIAKDYSLKSVKRLIFYFSPFLLTFVLALRLSTKLGGMNDFMTRVIQIYEYPNIVKNFFSSIGNMFFGWFIRIPELGGLSNYNASFAKLTFLVLSVLIGVSLLTLLRKRSRISLMILIFSVWIVIFYFPNWIFDKELILGGTHRYLGVSGVGFIALLAIAIGSIKRKVVFYFVVFIVMLLNIQTTKRILMTESTYRDKDITNMVWDKVDQDVPKNQKDLIFMYLGGDYIRGAIMDWSASLPFGVRRNITHIDDFPIPTADTTLILNLLCKDKTMRPSVSKWSLQNKRIPLSHIYAWDVTNGKIKNVSEIQRNVIKKMAEDINCTPLP